MQASIDTTALIQKSSIPKSLQHIPDQPGKLYIRGELPEGPYVAVVGSRKPTAYGRRVATALAATLASHGITLVSGLAFGIDAAVHEAALAASGRTVAVLPTGLDDRSISPQTNLRLAGRISRQGALLSEYPDGTEARKENYGARNRLISGLAGTVVIVEAVHRSGTMVTAKHAADQGKDVWAVPGQIDSPLSEGPNRLIADGANPLVSVEELLDNLGISQGVQTTSDPLLKLLGTQPVHRETLAVPGYDSARVSSALTKLELLGLVRHVGGGYYVRS